MPLAGQKRKREQKHPYLDGNFAPIQQTLPLTPCSHVGIIPDELAGGQYVRNGGNPVTNEDLGRDAHWFDGDGMLCGVSFKRVKDSQGNNKILPEFVNQYILTDLYLSSLSLPSLRRPIAPSIATLVNPLSSLITIICVVLRTVFLVALSFLAGSKQAIKKISVANTSVYYHDGRALAGCESGPPMRVTLPGLETVGWYDGRKADGETHEPEDAKTDVFGGDGLVGFMKEWTTAHPKIDQGTGEMILFHSTFAPPYVHYSIIPASKTPSLKSTLPCRLLNAPLPGVKSAKMMHDFGVSPTHTIIMDLPLSLDPLNLAKGKPVVEYNTNKPSRFGIFPRRNPSAVRWFETSACCIFHTANTWDSLNSTGQVSNVNLLSCRLTSASLVFSAGNLEQPEIPQLKSLEEPIRSEKPISFFDSYDSDSEIDEESSLLPPPKQLPRHSLAPYCDPTDEIDQCRLYYHSFCLSSSAASANTITHQFALAGLPFEFPSVRRSREMSAARYIYGCSTTTSTSFGTALGRAIKIDALVKIDALTLIARGKASPPRSVTGCVDTRTIHQIMASQDPDDPIKVFRMPKGWYAQEPRFVARNWGEREDDGFLLTYAFDEGQLLPSGECRSNAQSELWVVDARDMTTVVCRVRLPQRVPYGLHGNWFSEKEVLGQREVMRVRSTEQVLGKEENRSALGRVAMGLRRCVETWLG
ncbi:carotenoid oxygenase [Viridothelium virens]|uniref:Carotenoid oxygenase n=1 Tax=Viridothelium virens TaxID=1048519 RepID=A0A6A6HB61_VIRVR|nr:carotenoid oxygenase [Viridothelium virens]